MKWILPVLGGLVGLLFLITLIGWLLWERARCVAGRALPATTSGDLEGHYRRGSDAYLARRIEGCETASAPQRASRTCRDL